MKIYVGYTDYRYDGYSLPRIAFLNEQNAKDWRAKEKNLDYEELEIEDWDIFPIKEENGTNI